MRAWLMEALTRHARRRGGTARILAALARRYADAYANPGHDPATNGEWHLLRRLVDLSVVFDVGANRGQWLAGVRAHHPAAIIHAFELIPATRELLAAQADAAVRVHPFGLGDVAGTVEVAHFPDRPWVSTMVLGKDIHGDAFERLDVSVSTGDEFCAQQGIDHVDLLKVDAEGADALVLRGFAGMIGRSAITTIQFEYGRGYIFSRTQLRDCFALLAPNYEVGKLYPKGVAFKPYTSIDETYRGPNFVAVTRSRPDLIERVRYSQ